MKGFLAASALILLLTAAQVTECWVSQPYDTECHLISRR